MSAPLPLELRRRIVDAYNQGEGTYREIAARFSVGFNSVARRVGMDKYCNDFSAKPHAGGPAAIITSEQYPVLKLRIRIHREQRGASIVNGHSHLS